MKSLNDLSSPNYFKKVIFFTKALDLAFVLIAIKKPLTVGISLPQILEKFSFRLNSVVMSLPSIVP